jgi:Mn-dependent DtxR family transcriptional regulator
MSKTLRGEEIDKLILRYIASIPFSATTEMVAKELKIAWYTASQHLIKLEREGKIKYFRIGRQNQYILASRLKT